MFFIEGKTSQEAIEQYFASGYSSLSQFLEKCIHSDVLLLEKDAASAYEGTALREHASRLSDFLPAKHRLLGHGAEITPGPSPIYIELGVREGVSMRAVAEKMPEDALLFGLDTFTGLPEGWVPAYGNRGRGIGKVRPPGEMAVDAIPEIGGDRRVILVKGLFQDTLPIVIRQIANNPLFINVDCDTYTGALYGLTMLHPYLKKGDVIYFDEFVDEINEFAAFNDYVRSFYMRERLKLVGRAYDGFLFQVA